VVVLCAQIGSFPGTRRGAIFNDDDYDICGTYVTKGVSCLSEDHCLQNRLMLKGKVVDVLEERLSNTAMSTEDKKMPADIQAAIEEIIQPYPRMLVFSWS
jgi:hypothetical protein